MSNIKRPYHGYLTPWLSMIDAALADGHAPRRIAKLLFELGARALWASERWMTAEQQVSSMSGIIKHMMREPKPREKKQWPMPKSRPIDMGGIRDQWQHWTPETNARELGLI